MVAYNSVRPFYNKLSIRKFLLLKPKRKTNKQKIRIETNTFEQSSPVETSNKHTYSRHY